MKEQKGKKIDQLCSLVEDILDVLVDDAGFLEPEHQALLDIRYNLVKFRNEESK